MALAYLSGWCGRPCLRAGADGRVGPLAARTPIRRTTAALLVGAALAISACGESDEEKAQNQVCDARADIEQQVEELSRLTVSTATLDGIKQNLSAIRDDLRKIKDAEADLSDERKQEVQAATEEFGSEVESIVGEVGGSLSLSGAASQLESSLKQLGESYRQALAPIDC